MNKEELRNKFEKNVLYLKRNIPPDDIYMFAEQTFMAAMFFLHKWSEIVDVAEEARHNEVIRKWVSNIIGLQLCKEQGEDVTLDLDFKSVED